MSSHRLLLAALSASALVLPSCGKGSENDPPASPPAQAPSANTPPAAEPPMQGRSVSRPNQLIGAWMATTPGEFDGVEFLKDNQAMLVIPGFGTVTLAANLLDGGRLTLVNPQGETFIFQTTISGDALELTPERPGEKSQRFQRVPSGQTLPAAIQARDARLSDEMQERILALRDLIGRGDLVLTRPDSPAAGPVLALRFNTPDALEGVIVLDETPGRTNELTPLRVLPFRGETGPGEKLSNRVTLVLQAGPAAEPAGQQALAGPIRLTLDGPLNAQTITGTLHFNALSPTPIPVVLRSDPAAHSAVTARLDAQRDTTTREIDRMRAFLGGRITMDGVRTVLGNPAREPVRLTLEYNASTQRYDAVVSVGSRIDQASIGMIELLLGRAAVYVIMPWGEQWRLQEGDETGMLYGFWRPNANTDFLSHGNVELTTVQRWSTEEIAAEREALRRFLSDDLRSPQRFVGYVERRFGASNAARWPVSVEIQTDGSGAVTGSAWLIAHRAGVSLQGGLSGRTANLTAQQVLPGSADIRNLATQRWRLDLAALEPAPTFVGSMSSNMGGGGDFVLTHATPQTTAAMRERLVRALTTARYAARTADTATVRDEQVYFVFDSVDADTGQVTGRILGNGSKWRAAPPAMFEGEIVDERGLPILRLSVRGAPDPTRGNGETPEPFVLDLGVFEIDGSLHLTGSTPPGVGNQDWVTLDPISPDAEIPMDPARSVRLSALRLGASAVPARFAKPAPGDQMLVVVNITDRDTRVGQLFFAQGRYSHGNSVEAAAVHAGLATPGELAILRITFHEPFTEPVEVNEQNGVTTQRGAFRPNNSVPTFTLERVPAE